MRLLNKIIRLPSIFLIIILLIAFVLRVNNLNYNSPFLDEAMHIKLGKKVLADSWAEEAPFSWVGGLPLFYPRLSAYAYKVGGILGSRSPSRKTSRLRQGWVEDRVMPRPS